MPKVRLAPEISSTVLEFGLLPVSLRTSGKKFAEHYRNLWEEG
jgi:hypothetical protein